jgi:uncharacterized membrane protein YgcG
MVPSFYDLYKMNASDWLLRMTPGIAKIFLFLILLETSCQTKQKMDAVGSVSYKNVADNAGILSDSEEQKLTGLIQGLEKNAGSQLAIITVDSLSGVAIEAFALRTATDMKLGRIEFNDGLLIVVAMKERLTRIEVGYGLENIIKDEIASRIIREEIGPRFREQKFYDGLYTAVEKIKKLIEENKDQIGKMP